MSAAEIVTIIKAINDHVTVKYCDSILAHLNNKTNDHLKFEREFFNAMDKAVQKLINAITSSLNVNSSNSYNERSTNILAQIQMHCDSYNRWKKNVYDDHLRTMQQIEKTCNVLVQKTLKEKLMEQHNLFDTTLSTEQQNPTNQPPHIQNTLNQINNETITPSQIASSNSSYNWNSQMSNNSHLNDINQFYNVSNDQTFNDNTTNSTVFSNDNCEQSPGTNLNLTMPNFSTLNKSNNSIARPPIAPPKPPPPPTPYDDSVCIEDESCESNYGQQYECSICDERFDSQLQWLSHLRTHQKTMKSTKKKRKRVFNQIDETAVVSSNKSNKRRRYRFQCEYCDKRYFRLGPFIKHYNNHMKNNENTMCNFCCTTFQSTKDLQQHIGTYNAGMCISSGHYQCCQCAMTFEEKIQLNSHIKCKHKTNKDENKNLKQITNGGPVTNAESNL